MDLIMYA